MPEERYTWTDGSGRGSGGSFDYDNFAAAPSATELRCVEMDVDTGAWTDFNCEVSSPYICRIRALSKGVYMLGDAAYTCKQSAHAHALLWRMSLVWVWVCVVEKAYACLD